MYVSALRKEFIIFVLICLFILFVQLLTGDMYLVQIVIVLILELCYIYSFYKGFLKDFNTHKHLLCFCVHVYGYVHTYVYTHIFSFMYAHVYAYVLVLYACVYAYLLAKPQLQKHNHETTKWLREKTEKLCSGGDVVLQFQFCSFAQLCSSGFAITVLQICGYGFVGKLFRSFVVAAFALSLLMAFCRCSFFAAVAFSLSSSLQFCRCCSR